MSIDRTKYLRLLHDNVYPGRGVMLGLDRPEQNLILVSWIMGRSVNSRNRVYETEGGIVRTTPADPSKVTDPSLIIYNAMAEYQGSFVATNGDHTDTIIETLRTGTFREALMTGQYEPDAPNLTPRIAAMCTLETPTRYTAEMAILRTAEQGHTGECERSFYDLELSGGSAFCLVTYSGEGDPLPSYRGEPFYVPLPEGLDAVANHLWNRALDETNRVALTVKFINLKTGRSTVKIINRFEKVG